MNIYHWVLISFDSMFSCKGLIADMGISFEFVLFERYSKESK